jgi:DHA2 family multidrug resistance protein
VKQTVAIAQQYPGDAQRTVITVALILATILTSVASTIANTVLPQIRATTGASQTEISWVLTSFILAGVVMTPAIGWLEQRFGRRNVLLVSLAGFTLASAACGFVTNIYQLVLFRVLQGALGAMFIPMSQAILLDINPPDKHGQAMSVWGMGAVLGPIIGPMLGGWLSDNLDWRWVFFMNIPLAVLAFFLIATSMPKHQRKAATPFDGFGFGTLAMALIGLQLMLDRGSSQEWFASPEIWAYLAISLLSFHLFIVHAATSQRPIIHRSILADRNFILAGVMIFFVGILMFAGMAVLPTLMQNLLGYPVLTTGLAQAPRGVGTLISMFIVGKLVGKMDSRLIILTGVGLTAASYFEMSQFSLDMDDNLILVSGLLQGLGLGLIFVPLMALAFTSIKPQLRTEAASFFTLIRNVGSSIGISMVGVLQIINGKTMQTELAQHATPDNPNVIAALPQQLDLTSASGQAVMNGMIQRQSALVAYIDSFHLLFMMCLAIIPLLFLLRTKRASHA